MVVFSEKRLLNYDALSASMIRLRFGGGQRILRFSVHSRQLQTDCLVLGGVLHVVVGGQCAVHQVVAVRRGIRRRSTKNLASERVPDAVHLPCGKAEVAVAARISALDRAEKIRQQFAMAFRPGGDRK